ncbi:unnamed protein product [Pleuronectes platessa]|uniref:Uncharacterized protein n=1 Tax=Pleuronectes platessa TaxID=8262 RepID=A0A9N7VGA1_PLEPL|nr:unnamed protein product [Pleuronectes platessa]
MTSVLCMTKSLPLVVILLPHGHTPHFGVYSPAIPPKLSSPCTSRGACTTDRRLFRFSVGLKLYTESGIMKERHQGGKQGLQASHMHPALHLQRDVQLIPPHRRELYSLCVTVSEAASPLIGTPLKTPAFGIIKLRCEESTSRGEEELDAPPSTQRLLCRK